MARTHAQRRRQNTLLTLALVATLVVVLFARDVTRSAHASRGVRLGENRSFGALANGLLAQEGLFDRRLGYLLTHGARVSRPDFAARLDQLARQLPVWSTEAALLRRPPLAHGVNDRLAHLTGQRVDDYQVLLDEVARSLGLPWTTLSTTSLGATGAVASLLATDRQWGLARWSLSREPGRVRLEATTTSPALTSFATTLATLVGVGSLQFSRAVRITAVAVTPAPLPAPVGELLLAPVTSVRLGVSVSNLAYVDQPVTLVVTFAPASGIRAVQRQRMTTTLGALASFAFVPRTLTTFAGERGRLTIVLTGTPAIAHLTVRRTYRVVLSPSGAG